jgi:glycosyltransferase involved in cell wall biosynthesis
MQTGPCANPVAARSLPVVAAVITHYARPALLARAIGSVLSQVHAPDAIVVVDDASPDDPIDNEVLGRLLESVKYVRSPTNLGPSGARNLGLRTAQSTVSPDLVAFLDCDDMWLPQHLTRLVASFTECRHRTLHATMDPTAVREDTESVSLGLAEYLEFAVSSGVPNISRVALNAARLPVGPFDESLRRHEDHNLYLRCASEDGVRIVFARTALIELQTDAVALSERAYRAQASAVPEKISVVVPDVEWVRNLAVPLRVPALVSERYVTMRVNKVLKRSAVWGHRRFALHVFCLPGWRRNLVSIWWAAIASLAPLGPWLAQLRRRGLAAPKPR